MVQNREFIFSMVSNKVVGNNEGYTLLSKNGNIFQRHVLEFLTFMKIRNSRRCIEHTIKNLVFYFITLLPTSKQDVFMYEIRIFLLSRYAI